MQYLDNTTLWWNKVIDFMNNLSGKDTESILYEFTLYHISIGKTPGILRAAGIPLSVFHSWLTFKLFHDVTAGFKI